MKALAVSLMRELSRTVVLVVVMIAGWFSFAWLLGPDWPLALASAAVGLGLCACLWVWDLSEQVRSLKRCDRTRAQHQEHLHRRVSVLERAQQGRALMGTTHTRALVAACGCGRVVRCPDCATKVGAS